METLKEDPHVPGLVALYLERGRLLSLLSHCQHILHSRSWVLATVSPGGTDAVMLYRGRVWGSCLHLHHSLLPSLNPLLP